MPLSNAEQETAIVEAAREYVQQKRRGQYATLPDYFEQLAKAVDALDEEWEASEQDNQDWWAAQDADDEWTSAHDGQHDNRSRNENT